jgi:hypothetical protein
LQFEEALAQFRDFLVAHNYPPDVTWITPPDILLATRAKAYVKLPVPEANEQAVRSLFDAASAPLDDAVRELGPVFQAVGASDDRTFAYAWRPADMDQARRNLVGRGLKLSVAEGESRLRVMEVRGALRWRALRYRYRRNDSSQLIDNR